MSKYYTKRDRRIDIEFHPSSRAIAHGRQMAINAVAGEFGLWQRVREEPALDPRTHKGKGALNPDFRTAALRGII